MSDQTSFHTRLTTWAQGLQSPEPEFDFDIGWSPDYGDLLSGVAAEVTDPRALIQRAFTGGRVLLHGEGGTGKTTLARRLVANRLRDGEMAVVVEIGGWDAALSGLWEEIIDNQSLRLELLLEALGPGGADGRSMVAAVLAEPTLLVVDGLNEAPAPYPEQILQMLDAFSRTNPQGAAMATDRLVRRSLPSEQWQLAMIAAARPHEQPSPDAESSLMRSAFFLDLALRENLDSSSSSEAFHHFLGQHSGLDESGLAAAADAAFKVYLADASRMFSLSTFEATAGAETVEALRESGVLRGNDPVYFRHHLFHDFLAGVRLAANPDDWRRERFDRLTFQANSFDVLAMALQELEPTEEADNFLRAIYDWNHYGSAYALAKGRSLGQVAVSEGMELVLLAMLAERRWDPIQATVQRVEDALNLFPGSLAEALRTAHDRDEVIDLVTRAELPRAFEDWRLLFTLPTNADPDFDPVAMIEETDSLLGWTTANVLRRLDLDEDQLRCLREVLQASPKPVARWRAAHALGAHPSRHTVDALSDGLHDKDTWVRYGAVRSLVEVAASSAQERGRALLALKRQLPQMSDDRTVVAEFERAILLQSPPSAWESSVSPILERLWSQAESLQEQDHWREVASRLREAA